MNAFASDRATTDDSTDPSVESWLYRSEGFAEDLDDLVPAVLAPIAAVASHVRTARTARRWPAALGAGWLARPLGAR